MLKLAVAASAACIFLALESGLQTGSGSILGMLLIPILLGACFGGSGSDPRPTSKHVLYVDDEQALVSLIRRMLLRLGYTVTGHTNPAAALEEFRSRPESFDAVVTDLTMPGMSGFTLARGVLAIRPDVPVVIMSGYVRPEDQEAAHAMGIRDMLLKPNTVEDLSKSLDRLFRDKRAL